MEHGLDNNGEKAVRLIDRAVSYIVTHQHIRPLIFVAAFLEGIVSPLPPEALVAPTLAYRKDISWKELSFISALGSALGLSILYVIGAYAYAGHAEFFNRFISLQAGAVAQSVVTGNPLLGAFFSTFTPLLDRIFTLSAGVFRVSFLSVVIGLLFGRLLRVGVIAYFSHRFGPEARRYILRHSRIILVIGVLVIISAVLKALGIL